MCISRLGQIFYGVLALTSIVLIIISIFSPGWRKIEAIIHNDNAINNIQKIDVGLLSWFCQVSNDTPDQKIDVEKLEEICKKWWKEQPNWEKVVFGLMTVALIITIGAFAWNVMTFCACCCKGSIFKPLPAFAAIAGTLLGIALIIFYSKNQESIKTIDLKNINDLKNHSNTSYSFWLGVGACVASFINMIIGILVICLADNCL